ncbi:MAG TPA: Crp/Fnr family transcriptional regulator [Bryobacteraceae bacterium]|nr:Crp/Fnr family transcriptional regulator [Bryobacteraceae bacterium]
MNPRYSALANLIREDLLHSEGVRKLAFPRRGATVFASGTPATQVFFLDSGLVKIERTSDGNKDLLLGLIAPGEVFGEQALLGEAAYTVNASMMEPGTAWSIPTDVFLRFCDRRPEAWRMLARYILMRKEELERKVEHLCVSDVRQRILYYLTELAKLTPAPEGGEIVIHISQNELASLVGATRETTSTTLNALARQGLISLGHRLVTIPSIEGISEAMNTSRMARGAANGPVV